MLVGKFSATNKENHGGMFRNRVNKLVRERQRDKTDKEGERGKEREEERERRRARDR